MHLWNWGSIGILDLEGFFLESYCYCLTHTIPLLQPPVENYANPKTCFFHVLFKVRLCYYDINRLHSWMTSGLSGIYVIVLLLFQAGALAFYILSSLFFNSFVIIFVVTVFLAALDFWVVKNVSGRILVGLRWWNEINDLGESVWKFESLDQEVSA